MAILWVLLYEKVAEKERHWVVLIKGTTKQPLIQQRIYRMLTNLSLDDFYEVEVHQAAVERSLGLDASELAFLLLCAEKIVESIAFVESEVTFLVVGID